MSRQRRATIHDVARHAGVSAATVSKILNGVTTVKRANVDRVQEAIGELEYRADPLAAKLRQGQRRLIAVIVPELETSFFGALVSGIEEAAETAGYKVIFGTSRGSEERELAVIQDMVDWRVAGAIVVPVRSENSLGALHLIESGICSVLVDRVSASKRFDTVSADNYQASSDVADLLASQNHEHILVHCASSTSQAIEDRSSGFSKRMSEIAPHTQIDKLLLDDAYSNQRDSLSRYFDYLHKNKRPSAIFSLSQHSTLIALSELRRRSISIPDQVALVGFDDADWMQTTWPSITAVSQPVKSMAKQALNTLLKRLGNANDAFPTQHLERCVLQRRESTILNDTNKYLRRSMDN